MEEIISELVEKGIFIKVRECEPNINGVVYISYDVSEDYLCIYDFNAIVTTYTEKYVDGKLKLIALFDEYDEYNMDNIEEFKSDVKIYKKENMISEI